MEPNGGTVSYSGIPLRAGRHSLRHPAHTKNDARRRREPLLRRASQIPPGPQRECHPPPPPAVNGNYRSSGILQKRSVRERISILIPDVTSTHARREIEATPI